MAVEQRLEPTVDRAGRGAGELLVADHSRQLGEVGPSRAIPAHRAGPDHAHERAQLRVLARERGDGRCVVALHASTPSTLNTGTGAAKPRSRRSPSGIVRPTVGDSAAANDASTTIWPGS